MLVVEEEGEVERVGEVLGCAELTHSKAERSLSTRSQSRFVLLFTVAFFVFFVQSRPPFFRRVKNGIRNSKIHRSSSRDIADLVLINMAEQIARTAKEAFDASQLLDATERHLALVALKDALTTYKERILAANVQDIEVCS